MVEGEERRHVGAEGGEEGRHRLISTNSVRSIPIGVLVDEGLQLCARVALASALNVELETSVVEEGRRAREEGGEGRKRRARGMLQCWRG